ncbi:MAG: transposase [Armatimonadota bacterium]
MVGKREPTQFSFLNPAPPPGASRTGRLLQRVDELIDFEPVRQMVAPHFAAHGRRSIDPVLMIKLMLVGYLLGIDSDRELVEKCADPISIRRFLGLGLGEALPAHSSFTR